MKKRSKTSSFGTTSRIGHDASKYYGSRLYSELESGGGDSDVNIDGNSGDDGSAPMPDNPFPAEYENAIIQSSAERMNDLPDRCLHLMITSPPYNASKEYDEDLSLTEYLALLQRVFAETYRVLVNGGRACVNVANLGRRPYIPLSDYISRMMLDIGFQMRGEIIWNKAAGAGVSMAWGSFKSASNPVLRDVHEYILVFSKGSFARKRNADPDANGSDMSRGDTITKEQFMEWTKSVWTFNPESARKIGHPAPFPVRR